MVDACTSVKAEKIVKEAQKHNYPFPPNSYYTVSGSQAITTSSVIKMSKKCENNSPKTVAGTCFYLPINCAIPTAQTSKNGQWLCRCS